MLISCGAVSKMTDQKVYHAIKVSLKDKVATVELARPGKGNALNDDMWQEIPQVCPDASQHPCTACWAESPSVFYCRQCRPWMLPLMYKR